MILVDTSVWIDFLEGGKHWSRQRLKDRIQEKHPICYTEMILLEIIQGMASSADREEIEGKFNKLIKIPESRRVTLLAAEIYQNLRRKGMTIRSVVDCLIAASAIEHGARVLHMDRDFDFIARYYPLKVETQ